jgi:hypothetical protein
VLPEHEAESAWQLADTLHNPSKGENISPRWGVQRTYNCFDAVRVKSWSCVCWQDLTLFALLLLLPLYSSTPSQVAS